MATPSAATPAPNKQPVATPRSVPSPALYRAQPAAQMARTPQSNGAPKGGTPMVASLSQASAGSMGIKLEGVSPAIFGPASVGTTGTVSGLLNFASPNAMAAIEGMVIGAQPMSIGVSDVGQGKRNEDQERRNKVRSILDKLVGKDESTTRRMGMGRISDEGVRRVGRWAGFDVHIENKFQAKEHEGNRPIAVAGRNAVLIDLAFADNTASKVEVAFTSEDEEVAALQHGAAKVLKEDLTPAPGVPAINTSLDRFASNLEALARLDRLSSPTVNCVEAVAGVHSSLKRLYEHELDESNDKNDPDTHRAAKKVMREKSGKPGMHTHGRVGVSMDYWSEEKLTGSNGEAAPIDNEEVFSLEITVEANTAGTIPPIRISKNWIGKDVVKAADSTEDAPDAVQLYTGLDWREPPQLLSPPKDDAMNEDFSAPSGLPDVRFVARLHPPIAMPYSVATQVLQLTGLPSTPPVSQSVSYESLLLGLSTPPSTGPILTVDRSIFVPRPDVEQDVTQHVSLYSPKPEMACKLTAIPFSHPMHLVLALPQLRQWARLGHLLRTSFVGHGTIPRAIPAPAAPGKRIALDALFAADGERASQIDVTLSTGGGAKDPSLALFAQWDVKGPVCVRVAADGKISVTVAGVEDAALAKGLEIVDLGVWIEWARDRVGKHGESKEEVMKDAEA